MIAEMIVSRVWRTVRSVIVKRSTGWIAAGVILIAAVLTRWQPDWTEDIAACRDALTNLVWANETAITGVVGQLPADLR